MRRSTRRYLRLSLAIASAAAWVAFPSRAASDVLEWLPVRDPLYRELELLRAAGLTDSAHVLFTRPVSRRSVARIVARARREHPDSRNPSLVRLERAFGRELVDSGYAAPRRWTPPLADTGARPDGARLRLFSYADGTLEDDDGRVGFTDGSRGGGQLDAEVNDLLLHLDAFVGRIAGGQRFSDAFVEGEDVIAYSEDSYLSLETRWLDLTLGRSRSAWGPGATGSLLWSTGADPFTFFSFSKTLFGHVRGTAVHADVDAATGARLAAHRLEWFPSPALSVGIAEAARYTSSSWEPLYLVSVLPFTWVQRMLAQDTLDRSGEPVRNNVMGALDISWRPIAGTVLYGEFLLDDQGLAKGGQPTRIGYQAGWLGTGTLAGMRATWRGEYTRVNNFVYSVFYGEDFIHHAKPIGYPVGPDSRSLRVEGTIDPTPDWEVSVAAQRIERGEGVLGRFFDPDSGSASGSRLSGVVEETRAVEAGLRWVPRDGVDLSLGVVREWTDDAGHVPGAERDRWVGRFGVRLRK